MLGVRPETTRATLWQRPTRCMDKGCIRAHMDMDTQSTIARPPLALLQQSTAPCCRPVAVIRYYIMPMANLLRPYIRGQEAPILRGKDGRPLITSS